MAGVRLISPRLFSEVCFDGFEIAFLRSYSVDWLLQEVLPMPTPQNMQQI
jgi:hypothetical protein